MEGSQVPGRHRPVGRGLPGRRAGPRADDPRGRSRAEADSLAVVVTDMMMPEMTGEQLMEKITASVLLQPWC
jgi:CheY-like chemotaxis protein